MAEDLEDLYEHAPCGYLSLGPDGRIVKSNLTLSGWIGFTQEQLLGKRLRDILSVSGAIFYETHFAPLLRMQGVFNEVALNLLTAEGKKLAVLANAMERRNADGDVLFTRLTIFPASRDVDTNVDWSRLGLRQSMDWSWKGSPPSYENSLLRCWATTCAIRSPGLRPALGASSAMEQRMLVRSSN